MKNEEESSNTFWRGKLLKYLFSPKTNLIMQCFLSDSNYNNENKNHENLNLFPIRNHFKNQVFNKIKEQSLLLRVNLVQLDQHLVKYHEKEKDLIVVYEIAVSASWLTRIRFTRISKVHFPQLLKVS